MRNPLVIAAAALMLLSAYGVEARDRGPPDRFERRAEAQRVGAEARAERNYRRGKAGENRGRPNRYEPPPGRRPYPGPPGRSLAPGQVMPPGLRGAQVHDFNRYRLRPPPPGYDWVQVGPDIYLTQRATGMVLEAIPGGF